MASCTVPPARSPSYTLRSRRPVLHEASNRYCENRGCGLGGLRPAGLRLASALGATDDEVAARLPGDGLLPDPDLSATRAIGIDGDAPDVWPWLVQLGQGRGGFYTYDRLENVIGRADIHSADRIVREWQHFCGAVCPWDRGRPPTNFTWAFVLRDHPDGSTRLVVRERYAYTQRWAPLLVDAVEVVGFVMTQKMLRGIKYRVESGPSRHRSTPNRHSPR